MISILLWILASICNSAMDTLRNHYKTSIFKNLNPRFWNPDISHKYAKVIPYTGYKIDAWHLIKSAMVINICLSIALYQPIEQWWWDVLVYGILWNAIFRISYKLMFKV